MRQCKAIQIVKIDVVPYAACSFTQINDCQICHPLHTGSLHSTSTHYWKNRYILQRIGLFFCSILIFTVPFLSVGSILPEVSPSGTYVVVASQETYELPEWNEVVRILRHKYDASLILYPSGSVETVLPALQKYHPRFTAFVSRPAESGRQFVVSVHRLTRMLKGENVEITVSVLKDGTWGNRPLGILFPTRLGRIRGVSWDGAGDVLITDDFALLPLQGERNAGNTMTLTFGAYAMNSPGTSASDVAVIVPQPSVASTAEAEDKPELVVVAPAEERSFGPAS